MALSQLHSRQFLRVSRASPANAQGCSSSFGQLDLERREDLALLSEVCEASYRLPHSGPGISVVRTSGKNHDVCTHFVCASSFEVRLLDKLYLQMVGPLMEQAFSIYYYYELPPPKMIATVLIVLLVFECRCPCTSKRISYTHRQHQLQT
jgi:hypothetical protein